MYLITHLTVPVMLHIISLCSTLNDFFCCSWDWWNPLIWKVPGFSSYVWMFDLVCLVISFWFCVATSVNEHCYLYILARLLETFYQRRPHASILYYGSTPALNTFALQEGFGQKIYNKIGPSAIFDQFGPVLLLAITKTEGCFERPRIFRRYHHSGTCIV